MNSFANLASVMSEHPEVAKIWLGIIAQTKFILQEVPRSSLQSALLDVAQKAKTATARVAKSKSTASEELSQFTPTQTEQVDMSVIPMKRSRKEYQGHVTVNRLKPAMERGRENGSRKVSLALFVAEKITKLGPAKSASIWARSSLQMTSIRPSWTSKMAPHLCFCQCSQFSLGPKSMNKCLATRITSVFTSTPPQRIFFLDGPAEACERKLFTCV